MTKIRNIGDNKYIVTVDNVEMFRISTSNVAIFEKINKEIDLADFIYNGSCSDYKGNEQVGIMLKSKNDYKLLKKFIQKDCQYLTDNINKGKFTIIDWLTEQWEIYKFELINDRIVKGKSSNLVLINTSNTTKDYSLTLNGMY